MKQLFWCRILKLSCLRDSALSQHLQAVKTRFMSLKEHFPWGAVYCKAVKAAKLSCSQQVPHFGVAGYGWSMWNNSCASWPASWVSLLLAQEGGGFLRCDKAILSRRETVWFWLAKEGDDGRPLQSWEIQNAYFMNLCSCFRQTLPFPSFLLLLQIQSSHLRVHPNLHGNRLTIVHLISPPHPPVSVSPLAFPSLLPQQARQGRGMGLTW